MSTSIQITPSTNTNNGQSKLSSAESASNTATSEEPAGFTAVFASYTEAEPAVAEQHIDENISDILDQLLPQEMLVDGNNLPQADDAVMWQALLLMQPDENRTSNTPVNALQSAGLFDSKHKPVLNSSMLNQNFLNNLTMQPKEPGTSIPAGFAANNITAQLAAAHFIPDNSDALLANVNEQMLPIQGTSSNLSQSLAAVGLGSATQAATTQAQMAPLNLGQNAWESNLGSRLQMMVGKNIQAAEIRLDPPELGSLDIKIKVTNDVASVNITSPHTQVREALETAVPRLREMFEQSGLSLGDVNVRQESFAQQENNAEEEGHISTNNNEAGMDDETLTVTRKIVSDSLLDTYA